MTLRVHAEAAAEFDAAVFRYENERSGLGAAFFAEVLRGIATVEASPATWAFLRKSTGVRRFLLTRFPYALLYRIEPEAIHLLAVAHTKRLPGYWC